MFSLVKTKHLLLGTFFGLKQNWLKQPTCSLKVHTKPIICITNKQKALQFCSQVMPFLNSLTEAKLLCKVNCFKAFFFFCKLYLNCPPESAEHEI